MATVAHITYDDAPAVRGSSAVGNVFFWIAVGVLVLGIIIAVNVVAGVVLGWGSFDLTTGATFSVSPVTEETLQAITDSGEPCELEIYVAADHGLALYEPALATRAAQMLRLYAERSPHVSASFFTQQAHEGEFLQAGREVPAFTPNCVVVRFRDRTDVVPLRSMTADERPETVTDARGFPRVRQVRYEFRGEAALTSALQRALSGVHRRVYATVGHSEARWQDTRGPDGLGHWKARLEGSWIEVLPLALAQTGAVPEDCDVLVIAGPRAGTTSAGTFSEEEVDAIEAYLQSGGGVLLMLDPGTDPKLSRVLQQHGIVCHPGALAVDPDSVMAASGKDDVFLAERYSSSHPITAGFGGNAASDDQISQVWTTIPTAWSQCAVVLPAHATSRRAGLRVVGLVATGPDGWGETEPMVSTVHRRDPDRDIVGGMPGGGVTVAVASEATGAGRMVVLGTRRLVANEPVRGLISAADDHPRWQSNLALMRNVLSWLAGEDDFVSGVAGRGSRTRLKLDPRGVGHMFSIAFLYVPLTIILAGLTAWAHRRRSKRILIAFLIIDLVYGLYLVMRVLAPLESF